MGAARFGPAVATAMGSVYIFGGRDDGQDLSSTERFDPRTGTCTWEALPPMGAARFGPAVATAMGKVYVCGGDDGAQDLSSAECFP